MSFIKTIKNRLSKLPRPVVQFAVKSLVLFIAWEILYAFVLLPNRVVDRPLSIFTGKATAAVLNFFAKDKNTHVEEVLQTETAEGIAMTYPKIIIYAGNKKVIGIADSCNGLNLYVLYLGFILVYPSSNNKTRLKFALIGLVAIVAVNILRCTMLALLANKYPHFNFFAHHYLYKIIIYSLVFALWLSFIKSQQKATTNA
jgi:exosortase/archaeosortase family protein